MSTSLDNIARQVDAILERADRKDVIALLALLAGRCEVAKERASELRSAPASARDLTVNAAVSAYPVSRSFLYERGVELGVAHRIEGTRKLIVNEAALRRLLEGRRG